MAEKNAIVIPITLLAEGGGSVTDGVEGVESAGQTPSLNDNDKNQKQAETRAKSSGNAAKAVLAHAAAQTANLALQGLGDITGDYVQSSNLQLAISEAGKVVGAVALGAAGIAIYAIDKGVQAFNYVADLKKSEMQTEFARKRVYGATVKG